MKTVLSLLLIVMIFASCSRYITPYQAANGKARCGKLIR
jgi:hypothetical protein